jgi:hypothetical protein
MVQVHRPSSSSQPEERDQQDESQDSVRCEDKDNKAQAEGVLSLPSLKPFRVLLTPRKSVLDRDEDRLTSSALRGGAANELLRLSQGVGS